MKRSALAAAIVVLAWSAGCEQLGLFQDIGADPHPPSVSLVRIETDPGDPDDSEGPPPRPKPLDFDGTGYVLYPNVILQAVVSFADDGGDVVRFRLRDRDGPTDIEGIPAPPEFDFDGDGDVDFTGTAPEYFTGTAGFVLFRELGFTASQQGEHRIELWAEDSHGSRSGKIEFLLKVRL